MASRHIAILPEEVINKISAGEVIERPASAVKELLENSLDAGATAIDIEIKNGGKKLIQIADNGRGISAPEVPLSFQRHATSKISAFNDLDILDTLGFRGEALPSIAAVSKTTMVTRPADSLSAVKLVLQGGKIISQDEEGAKPGTTVSVESLFANTPARLKFLKSDATEFSHILNLITELAIANFKVAFTLVNNDRNVLKLAPAQKLEERLYDLFGQDIQKQLLPINLDQKFLSITGFITSPAAELSGRNQQYFFVNKRTIRHRLLNHALTAGYDNLLPTGKYPAVFIFFSINPELVDVNVHPAKREVRFSNEGAIHDLTVKAIRDTLHQPGVIREMKDTAGSYQIPLDQHSIPAMLHTDTAAAQTLLSVQEQMFLYKAQPAETLKTAAFGDLKILGQADNAYIVASSGNELMIIDQHAASERVMYEKFKHEFEQRTIQSQKLLIPITLEIDVPSKNLLLAHGELLSQLGWEVEDFGATTLLVRALPAILEKAGDRQFILDIVQELARLQDIKDTPAKSEIRQSVLDNILKLSACHAAVRFGDQLQPSQISTIVSALTNTHNPYTCPHGRPTLIKLSRAELNKRFERT
ncbi:MAG: DNA mismatch repair endonuclease MutL [bacterium]|nr:DNA mismatch repair endonuclease MutL [bacterium]MDD5354086.1 DNA mismatch repair endonuclease MutL [bacterium]